MTEQHRPDRAGEDQDRDRADDALLAELAGVLDRVGGPPPALVDAARQLFTWRTVDAELAELTHDSALDAPVGAGAAGVRAGGQSRILTFETGGLTVEVEVDEAPGARRLIGQLAPPGEAELELRTADGSVPGRADGLGRFVLDLPAERVRSSLRIRRDGRTADTAWVPL